MNAGRVLYNLVQFLFWTIAGILYWFVPMRLRPHKSIKNQIVLLTGAGNGLGRQLALKLADLGAHMVLWDINKKLNEETERLIKKNGGQAKGYVCDITDRQAVYETMKKVKDEVGPVSILINNAGIYLVKNFINQDDKGVVRTMDTNALSNFWTIKSILPEMMAKNKGHLVSIISISGLIGVPTQTDYCASKFAAMGFMEALKAELSLGGYHGIKSTIVCPYFFDSGLYKNLGQGLFPELKVEEVVRKTVEAILTERSKVIVPETFSPVVWLNSVIPDLAKPSLGDLLGIGPMLKNIASNRNNFFESGTIAA